MAGTRFHGPVPVLEWLRRRPHAIAAIGAWIAVQTLVITRALPGRIAVGPDGVDFLRVSRQSLLSGRFWGASRAPTFPLLLRVLPGHVHWARLTQVAIAAGCWAFLSVVLSSKMRTTAGRVVVFAGVLLLSATVQVTIWNGMAMAESLAMSLLAASLATVLLVPARWSWSGLCALVIVGTLFVFVRDTNALLALVVAAAMSAGVALRRVPRRALVAAVLLVLVSFGAMASSSAGDRWLQPLHHVVKDRVVVSRSATEWFEDRGMPDADLVRTPAANDYVRYGVFWRDPRFRDYLDWLRTDGRAALLTYMARHPSFLGKGRFAAPSTWAGPSPSVRSYQGYLGTSPAFGSVINALVWPESPWIVFPLELLAVAVGLVVAVWDRERRVIASFGVASVVLGMALVVAAANLDTAETPRHVIVPMAMARIGVLAALAAGIEAAATKTRNLRGHVPEHHDAARTRAGGDSGGDRSGGETVRAQGERRAEAVTAD
jgi:hypothetical protein